MKKDYILFIDSGIGGLSTLSETCKVLSENYIYFADTKNCPYGSHKKHEIIQILKNIIDSISSSYKIKMIVLACNTATTSAVFELRKEYPHIPIIGTEPAVNLAKKCGYKRILSLTTPATSRQVKYNNLVRNSHSKIHTTSIPSLALNIEKYYTNPTTCNYFYLLKDLFKIKKISQKYDCVVLGCTHYVLASALIKHFSQKPVIDGNIGISRQIIAKLNDKNQHKTLKISIKFLSSDTTNFAKENYKKILSQILAKR